MYLPLPVILIVAVVVAALAVSLIVTLRKLERMTSERETARDEAHGFKNLLCNLALACANIINGERISAITVSDGILASLDPAQRASVPPEKAQSMKYYRGLVRLLRRDLALCIGIAKERARLEGQERVSKMLAPWTSAREAFIFALARTLNENPDYSFEPATLRALDPEIIRRTHPERAPSVEWYEEMLDWMRIRIIAIIARSGFRAVQ